MQSFDPELIRATPVTRDDDTLGFDLTANDIGGTAYYRLPKEVKEFLETCNTKHGIAGFEWDAESPWNFGIILKSDTTEANPNGSEQSQPKDD